MRTLTRTDTTADASSAASSSHTGQLARPAKYSPVMRQNWRPHPVNRRSNTSTTARQSAAITNASSTHSVELTSSLLQSMGQVRAASDFEERAAGLDDEQLRKAAKLLDMGELAESSDIPQFLAIAREASERATTLRPFDVQLLGALRMLAGVVVAMAT